MLSKRNFIIVLFGLSSLVFAAVSPVVLLDQTAIRLIKQLKQHRQQLKQKPELLVKIVNKILIPRINQDKMAQYVVGRTHWRQATAQQRSDFLRYFTRVVISTYAEALHSYSDQKISFAPIRGRLSDLSVVNVHSEIEPMDGPVINVVYQMLREKGTWKIIDFSVDGVSLVQSYRSQFADVLLRGGMVALLKELRARQAE